MFVVPEAGDASALFTSSNRCRATAGAELADENSGTLASAEIMEF